MCTVRPQVPGGSAGRFLLGVICRKTNRIGLAIDHFRAALAADPFCWSAFEELCALGDDKEAAALLSAAKYGRVLVSRLSLCVMT